MRDCLCKTIDSNYLLNAFKVLVFDHNLSWLFFWFGEDLQIKLNLFHLTSRCDSLSVTIIRTLKVELMLVCVSHTMVLLISYWDPIQFAVIISWGNVILLLVPLWGWRRRDLLGKKNIVDILKLLKDIQGDCLGLNYKYMWKFLKY